jgi:hypothetical protein
MTDHRHGSMTAIVYSVSVTGICLEKLLLTNMGFSFRFLPSILYSVYTDQNAKCYRPPWLYPIDFYRKIARSNIDNFKLL